MRGEILMLNVHSYETAPIAKLDLRAVTEFCENQLVRNGAIIPLAATSDSNLMADLAGSAGEYFSEDIASATDLISDRDIGIAGMDIPIIYDDPTKDAICGALVAVSISQHIMPSLLDKENKTPFSMFNASPENNAALAKAGMKNISPTDILDFHSDGSVLNDILAVPDYISIYNVFINYNQRGSFYWVPSSSISNLNSYIKEFGYEQEYLFDLTPTVYSEKGSEIKSIVARRARTSIFQKNSRDEVITFMNGSFLGKATDIGGHLSERLAEFQHEISTNGSRYAVPQESRRMVLLNNASGFHARDIFEDPIDGYPITRCYLRSASASGRVVGEIVAN